MTTERGGHPASLSATISMTMRERSRRPESIACNYMLRGLRRIYDNVSGDSGLVRWSCKKTLDKARRPLRGRPCLSCAILRRQEEDTPSGQHQLSWLVSQEYRL
jgi:hypothetical protein